MPNPFNKKHGGRLYKTGDLARYLPDGNLELLGRNDHQVKVRGYRIELGEIEARLTSHPEVREAVVAAREEGEGSKRLVAYYTGEKVGAEALRAHLSSSLPVYMTPSAYVHLERLPMTPNGKLDRRALPTPEGEAYVRRGYKAPEGETERKLARIWAEVLKLERVGRDDNFFELGGHSLLAVRLIERMRREGLRANVRTVYTNPILAAFAAAAGGESRLVEVPPNRIPAGSEAITPEMLPLVELSVEEIEIIVSKVPGGAANVQDIYPLAPLQEGMLFHFLLEAEEEPYLGQVLYSFDSRSRLDSFLQAVQAVIDRHDILRTAVQWEGLSEPAQVVWRRAPLIIEEVNCDPAAGDVAEQLRARYSPRRYRLDISQAPMMRAYIAPAERGEDAPESRWLMFLLFHHLAVDQLTVEIVLQEVQAHLLGRADQLPAPLPFRNFVAQARLGVSREEHEEFFRAMLGDVDEPTAPFGLLGVQGDGSGIEGAGIKLEPALDRRLRNRARALGVSVASLWHLAWAQALARVSGRDDVVFGTVLFGRMQGNEGADRALGLFINTLPMRINIGEEGVERSVRKTHGLLADLMKHEHASLALAQRCSGVAAPAPLFSSLLNYRHSPRDVAPSPEAPSAWMGIKLLKDAGRTNYPVALSVDDFGDGFALSAQVVAGIDPVGVCGYMRTALEGLVEALEGAPERAVRAIEVMPEAERRQLVKEWNATEVHYSREKLIHELFEEQAERSPDAVALVYEEQSLTYDELNVRANRLAHHLRALGVGPEARVAICVERSLDMVVALLATFKAGGAYVPLDPAYPPERLAYMLEDSEPAVLLTNGAVKERLAGFLQGAQAVDLAADAAQWGGYNVGNPDRASMGPGALNLAYIIYTSGSTGAPKGVMVGHANVVRLLEATDRWFGFGSADVWTLFHSYAFDFSVWELWGALACGGRLVVVPQSITRSPEEFYGLLCRDGVTVLNQTPSAFRQLITAQSGEADRHSLRCVIFGGEALDVVMLKPWFDRNGDRRTQLVNMYGITETTVHVTYRLLEPSDAQRTGASPIGRRIPDLKTYILDANQQPAPIGVAGELHIGGAGVARGYFNRPEVTAERFLPDPFGTETGGRIYKTGDLGRWQPEGEIGFLGRNDFQVKNRGFRIEPGEIETVLMRHPGVQDAVVTLKEYGPEDKRLVAYLVPDQQRAFTVRQLLRLERQGPLSSKYELPNSMAIIHINKGETDFMYKEIFEERTYAQHGITLNEGDCIFDVGANIGLFTLFAGLECRNTVIYAFEPVPTVFDALRMNAELYGLNVKLFNCGLSDLPKSEVITFYPKISVVSGLYADDLQQREVIKSFLLNQERLDGNEIPASNGELLDELLEERLASERITCHFKTISDVIRENSIERIDLLKVDVEKSELDVLSGIEGKDWEKIRQCVVEVHDIDGRMEEITSLLNSHGYEVTVQQDAVLKDTGLYNVYAVKVLEGERLPGEARDRSMEVSRPAWYSQGGLISDVREFLRSKLPDYMAPAAIVTLDALPLTPNGKLDRRALPVPEGGAYHRRDYEAPNGETERKLAQIWAETLKVERIGRHDNFFELGGHSLLVITVIERMRREEMQADVRTIFTAPTLRTLAEAIRGKGVSKVETPPNLIPAGCQRVAPEMLPLIALTQSEIDAVAALTPGGAANIQDIYPLAPLQEGILFHHLMSAEGDAYLLSSLLAFDTRERLERFIGALQAVVDRHDILRTAVVWEGLPEPAQVVWREAPLSVEEVRLDPKGGRIDRQLLTRFDPRRYRLDVRQAPLLRGFVAYDAAEERWLLLWLIHHLTIDHTTLEIMTREAQAHLSGEADGLPEPMPFRNFVAQARLGVGGISREEHEAFFREMLGDVDEPTAPFGLTDAQGDGSGIEQARLALKMGLSRRLRERARMLGVSAASLCHLAWALVLARVSGREDVVFGTVLFGRIQGGDGSDRTMGLFINTLPIRIRVDEEGVERSAKRAQRMLAELIAHEHASLALAQRCSGVEAPAPLFSALLNYRHNPRETEAKAAEAETARAWTGVEFLGTDERTNYPLMLSVDDLGDSFALKAQTITPVDPRRVNELMRTALEGLVKALEGAPETAVRAIDVMPEAERRQLVEEWNATEVHYPREKLIHELFEEQVERTPDAVALVCEDRQLSYRELNRRANQLGHHLLGLGVRPEAVVGICVERSLEMVIGILGVLKAGGAYLPLDPDYPEQRLAYIAEDARPAMMVTGESVISRLPKQAGPLVCIDRDWEEIGRGDETNRESRLSPGNLAYVLYTSGSTGNPKGVAIAHSNAVTLIHWAGEIFGPEDLAGVLASTSICFDLSVFELFVSLSWGGKVILVENVLQLPNSPVANGVTLINTVPSAMAELMRMDGVAASVRAVNLAGEPLRIELVDKIYRQETVKRVYDLYGPSEGTTYSTFALRRAMGPGTIGRPIANTQVYLLDTQLQPVPVGVKGEIYLGGEGLSRCYLQRCEMTAERWMPNPFNKKHGGRLYKTGDLARYLPDGNLELLGRNDHQVKVRGYRIELGEIEAVLEEHQCVRQSVIVAREDERGDKRLLGYVVCEEVTTAAELKRHVRERLPKYMVPETIVTLDEMPLTANGKIDRKRLPAVKDAGRQLEGEYVGARTPMEEMLIGIFEEVLKLDRVGREDNFFEIGGHSLLAMQIVARVRNTFGVDIGVRSVFEEPAAEGLARKIEEAMRAGKKQGLPPLVRASREERLPLSFAQQRLWFIDQLDPGNATYNISDAVRLKGGLNIEALERVINEVVRRHEALRTRIEVEAGEPAQVIDAWEPRSLDVIDLRRRPPVEREAEVRRRIREEVETGFDLRRGPLLRVKVLKLEEEEHVVIYTMSHIVSDGWSMGVLMREVGALYQAYLAGASSPLEELEIQYADYAKWQRQYVQGELLNEQLEYWRKHLGGELPELKLVTDRPQPAERTNRGAHEFIALPPELARRIVALSRHEGVTLFMALLAAFKVLLSRYSGQEDIIVGTVIANRNSIELEKLIGFFVNTLPLRTNLAGDPTFRELLARVKEVVLGAYAHQDAPFEKLVEELQPERSLNQTPLFRVAFILQNAPASTSRPTELTSTPAETGGRMATFDLTLSMTETSQGLIGVLQYAADLFDDIGIKKMLIHFQTLLENIVEDPDRPISSLRLLRDLESDGMGLLDFPDLPLNQRDVENILIELNSMPGR